MTNMENKVIYGTKMKKVGGRQKGKESLLVGAKLIFLGERGGEFD